MNRVFVGKHVVRVVALAWILVTLGSGHSSGQGFVITEIRLETNGVPRITHLSDTSNYYALFRGSSLSDLSHPVDIRVGLENTGSLADPRPLALGAFYRILRTPIAAPLDLDRDGMNDIYEIDRAPALNPLNPADALADADGDLRSNLAEARAGTDPMRADFFVVPSPRNRETGVSVNRETVLRFTLPLAETATIGNSNLWAEAGGRRLLTRPELSSDRRRASLFYLEPVPGSTRVRVFFDGTGLSDAEGRPLDLDADGQPGGLCAVEFTTAGFSAVAGTGVTGRVFASEWMEDPSVPAQLVNRPLPGVTITVDGAEESLRTTTDEEGKFVLSPCPAGRFFVHVDGRTYTNTAEAVRWPDQAYYPFVGKAWEAVAGVMTNLAGGTGEIYLPLIPAGALQSVNATDETNVGFLPQIIATNPALADVVISIPPNALFDDAGVRGGRVGLAAVDPGRLPEPLPPGLTFPVVITVQTDGPQNFDQPVPVKFPNLPDPATGMKLPPGAKSALWSFDHDKGTWEIVGPMTVSDDGLLVVSDAGVGIRQPGWHGTNPGSGGGGPPPAPPRNNRPTVKPPRPPLSPPAPPPPPPPPAPEDSGDEDDEDDDDSLLPEFPEIPDLPFIEEPESWGDLVSMIVDELPTLGPDVFGPIVDIGKEGAEMFEELGDVIGSHTVQDSNGDGVPDVWEARDEFWDAIRDAAEDQLPAAPENASDASNTLKDWWDIWQELYGEGSRSALHSLARRVRHTLPGPPEAALPFLNELQEQAEDLDHLGALQDVFDAYFRAILGDERWNALSSAGIQFRELLPVLAAIADAQGASSPEGVGITSDESNGILAVPSERVSASFRQEAIARFNLTVSQNAQRIFLHSEASATSRDFIDAAQEQAAVAGILSQIHSEQDAGFATPGDRGLLLAQRMGDALGGFFAAYSSAPPLEPSSEHVYPVHLEIFPPGGGVLEQHLKTDTVGQLEGVRVPANATVIVRWLDPATMEIATSFFFSGPPGTRFVIPEAVWNENTPAADADGDGLPDIGEFIVGTRVDSADTDGDGMTDGAELRSGTNPLDGIILQPGIANTVDTPGNAVDIAAETYDLSRFGGPSAVTRILVADGTSGVAVLELIGDQPVLLGQVDTPGDARRVALPPSGGLLADEVGLAAAADGAVGLVILDIQDPAKPRLLRQVPLEGVALSVTLFGGVAYVGSDSGILTAVDLFTGEVLDQRDLGYPIQDLKPHRGKLHVVGPKSGQTTLQAVPLLDNGLFDVPETPLESPGNLSRRGLRLAIGEEVAYVVHGKGYNTWLLPATDGAPLLAGTGDTTQFGWKQIAPDGLGLGVAGVGANGSDDGEHDVSIYDLSDPTRTDRLLTTIVTPGLASAVVLHGGRALVADGRSGVHVLHYTASDLGTNAPTIQLDTGPEQEIPYGTRITATALVRDDIAILSAELFLDGIKVAEDRTWPYEFGFPAPSVSELKSNLLVQVRAFDTAGNSGWSTVRSLTLVPDTTAPRLLSIQPDDGRAVLGTDSTIVLSFDEPMDLASLSASTVQLTSAGPDNTLGTTDDTLIPGAVVSFLERANRMILHFPAGWAVGQYRIVISQTIRDANGNALGQFVNSDFRVVEGDLRNGGTFVVEGSLPDEGVEDGYTFWASAGQPLFFDLQSQGTLGLRLTITDEIGEVFFSERAIGDAATIVLPQTQRYRLFLERVGEMTAEYRVVIWDVPAPQQFTIAIGDEVSDAQPTTGAGNIETPGVRDSYTFQAAAGQRVYFDLLEGGQVGQRWRLTDPDGVEVFNAFFIGDVGTVTLEKAGTYGLTVGTDRTDVTGAYRFRLWDVPSPQSFAISIDQVVSNNVPAAGAGNIETPGVHDIYTFTATAGQRVFFDLIQGLQVGQRWRLTDPDGSEVFNDAFIGDVGTVAMQKDGTYTLTVGTDESDVTGAYQIRLWNVPPAPAFPIAIGDVVSDGVPGPGAGNIETPGTYDIYTFSVTAGERVYFDLLEGPQVGQRWRLTTPEGVEVFNSFFISDEGAVTLEKNGGYTLTVGADGNDVTGTYRFQLWRVPPPQVFPISIDQVVSNGVPAVGAGNIETPGAQDTYTFTAAAGQRVYFDLIQGVQVGQRWRLADPDGTEVFNGLFIRDEGTVVLEKAGTHALTIGNDRADVTGDYVLRLWNIPAAQTFPIQIGDIVSDGVPAAGAGNIESPGAHDVYTFTAQAGQHVDFDLISGIEAGQIWELTDDAGVTVFSRSFISDATDVVLEKGGVYTLTVGTDRNDAVGAYQFQIRDVTPP